MRSRMSFLGWLKSYFACEKRDPQIILALSCLILETGQERWSQTTKSRNNLNCMAMSGWSKRMIVKLNHRLVWKIPTHCQRQRQMPGDAKIGIVYFKPNYSPWQLQRTFISFFLRETFWDWCPDVIVEPTFWRCRWLGNSSSWNDCRWAQKVVHKYLWSKYTIIYFEFIYPSQCHNLPATLKIIPHNFQNFPKF